jgi:hypothetical protein
MMVGFIELDNPAGKGLTLFQRLHLWGKTLNMHRTASNIYSHMSEKFIYCANVVFQDIINGPVFI